MKNKDTYKNKVQNMFTAYVVKSVEGKRMKYLAKRNYTASVENYLEDYTEYEPRTHFDEEYAAREKDRLLEAEEEGIYPAWEELSNDQLIRAIKLLQKEERELIFKHVFEEKTFEQMSEETGEARNKIENRYYYAIKKIRRWMGGDRS